MTKIIKNPSGVVQLVADTGIRLPIAGTYTIPEQDYLLWAASSIAVTKITAGLLVVNDGIRDLSITDGINFLKNPDFAFNIRFLNNPERVNGFTARTVQEAIEEARSTAEGKTRFTLPLLNNSTMSNNQSVTYSELFPNTHIILPRACVLKEVTFANQLSNADARFDFYRGTEVPGNLLFSWTIVNSLTAVISGLNHAFTAGQNILIKFRDTGDNPSDTAMVLFFNVS